MATFLIAGGTGLIGVRLTELLLENKHQVRILTRRPTKAGDYNWNPDEGTLDPNALDGVDYVINLAGAGIADRRWTILRKKVLIESRTQSTNTLVEAIRKSANPPKAFINASAIGIYGDSGEEWQTEDTPIQQQNPPFMVQCCDLWEQEARKAGELGIRTVIIRIGVVLTPKGGAWTELARPIQWFRLGTYFGKGDAWYSWISLDDICRIFIAAAENPNMQGVYNGVSPQPARNREIVKMIANYLGKRAWLLPVPSIFLKMALGEMSAVVLNSNRVSAQKLLNTGFQFENKL